MNAAMTVFASEHTEEGRAFLQSRVARAGLIAASLGGMFLFFRVIDVVVRAQWASLAHPSLLWHLGAVVATLVMWVTCGFGVRAARQVRIIEAACLWVACSCYTAMGSYIPIGLAPQYITMLAIAFGLIARAIYVPSTATRTLVLTLVPGVPLVAVTLYMFRDGALPSDLPAGMGYTEAGFAAGLGITMALWWVATVAVCTGASRVIYGLRQKVHDARKLGQYELVEKLGQGGMGVVYRARHAMLRRPTAVKLLAPGATGEHALARFEKEVQLTAELTHPNTVTIFDYGRTPENIFYYAMELLKGATLQEIVETKGAMPPARVVHVLAQVAGALAEAHERGLIHRDIKPANIMLVQQGGEHDVAKVLDFGLVKELQTDNTESLTQAGAIAGTPQYMSPDAIKSPETVDARSDLYSLGAVGYYLATGRHVFEGRNVFEVCSQHLSEQPKPPSELTDTPIPRDLESILLRCLEKDPDDRPASAAELRHMLDTCQLQSPWTSAHATAWWTDHAATFDRRPHGPPPTTGVAPTLDIDVADRLGGMPTEHA